MIWYGRPGWQNFMTCELRLRIDLIRWAGSKALCWGRLAPIDSFDFFGDVCFPEEGSDSPLFSRHLVHCLDPGSWQVWWGLYSLPTNPKCPEWLGIQVKMMWRRPSGARTARVVWSYAGTSCVYQPLEIFRPEQARRGMYVYTCPRGIRPAWQGTRLSLNCRLLELELSVSMQLTWQHPSRAATWLDIMHILVTDRYHSHSLLCSAPLPSSSCPNSLV